MPKYFSVRLHTPRFILSRREYPFLVRFGMSATEKHVALPGIVS